MNILLTGATGFIGSNILYALESARHKVNSLSKSQGVDFNRMLNKEDWLPYLIDIDVVINCVGIIGENSTQKFDTIHAKAPIALFKACEEAKIKRVIQISAMGTNQYAFSDYHLSKLKADEFLRSTDLDWFILRPSLIYGKGSKSAELMMKFVRLPVIPVIGKGEQILQPIHISDVINTIITALESKQTQQTLDIVGEEVVTLKQWLKLMRQAQRLEPTKLVYFPVSFLKLCAHFARYINPIFQTENFDMLQSSYYVDYKPCEQFLGRKPLKLASHLFFIDFKSMEEVA